MHSMSQTATELLADLLSLLSDEDLIRLRHRARKRGELAVAEILNQMFYEREHEHVHSEQPAEPR